MAANVRMHNNALRCSDSTGDDHDLLRYITNTSQTTKSRNRKMATIL